MSILVVALVLVPLLALLAKIALAIAAGGWLLRQVRPVVVTQVTLLDRGGRPIAETRDHKWHRL